MDQKDGNKNEKVWTTLDPESAKDLPLDRDSSTPMILGQRHDEMGGFEHEGSLELDPKRVFEELKMNTWKFAEKLFRTEAGKQGFMNWLFRLTDTDHTGEINVTELEWLLDAVRTDGIQPEEFYCSIRKKHTPIEKIMAQFDTDTQGIFLFFSFFPFLFFEV